MTGEDGLDHVGICRRPVFIIGAPRSGTTALALALAEHSDFWYSDESMFLFHLFGDGHFHRAFHKSNTASARWLRLQHVDKAEFLGFLGTGINALFTSRSEGRRWIDKTPTYTYIGELLVDMFPTARFVHMLRDGRRTVHSMLHFAESPGVKRRGLSGSMIGPFTQDFGDACRAWDKHVRAAAVASARAPDRFMTTIHDDLVRAPEREFARLLAFLDSPYEDGPARYIRSHRVNSSFGPDSGSPPPINKASLPSRRWTSEERNLFAREAGQTMVTCGLASWEELGAPGQSGSQNEKNQSTS